MTAYSRLETRFAAETDHLAQQAMLETIDQAHAIAEYAADGTLLRANERFVQMLGYTTESLVGRHYLELCLPGDEAHEIAWEHLAQGQGVSGEFQNLARDGRHLWLLSHFHPTVDSEGVVLRVLHLASDLTDSKDFHADVAARLAAIDRVQAVIEFDLGGHVLHANDIFLDLMGYRLEDIQGQHHRMFCTPGYSQTAEYTAFWDHLASGQVHSGEFKRLGKDGREVWIQASYNPVLDSEGQPVRVIKFATDITERKQQGAEVQALIDAIDRVQAVIEFDLSGHVLHANDNFLRLMGYSLSEIRGQHHRLFCEPAYAQSRAYDAFWDQLASGRVHSGEFRRLRSDGQPVWIQASYNPVFDPEGYPVKVVKFATDITDIKRRTADNESLTRAIDRVQGVVEFDLSGHVLHANDNFLETLGYTLDEVVGQHHRMFCTEDRARSPEYQERWAQLARGELLAGVFHQVDKQGNDVWVRASYNPVFDTAGRVLKVVEFSTDITEAKRLAAEATSKIDALSRSQAVVEFDLEGHVLSANANFLRALGYTEHEVLGQHHSLFCPPDVLASPTYRHFWADLAQGRFQSGRFCHLSKQGTDVWIQATYNPVLDHQGRPWKIVKFAMDVTEQVQREQRFGRQIDALSETLNAMQGGLEHLDDQVRQSRRLGNDTQHQAEESGRCLTRIHATADALCQTSDSVHQVLGLIGEIAGQSHQTALNGAVEAARAGEQGLVVVTEEMRRLADRSSEATRELARHLSQTGRQAEEGRRLSGDTETCLRHLLHALNQTRQALDEIQAAAQQQALHTQRASQLLAELQQVTTAR